MSGTPFRSALLLALACGCGEPRSAGRTDLTPITRLASWDACGRCHPSVYQEWKGTLHAGAWLDPLYRMSAGDPPRTECRSCHSMEPILARDFSTAYEYRPVFRDYNHEDGVNCAACHLRADGRVAGRRTLPDAPCRPVRDDRITTPEYCGACHNPTHDAYNEWKSSAVARSGVACSDCHSKPVPRERGTTGFSHTFPGGNDGEFVRKAVRIGTRLEGREVVLTIENLTGHRFPGEVPTRLFVIEIQPRGADGAAMEPFLLTIKRPYKTQLGVADNRLAADERREVRHPLPPATASVRVTCTWRPSLLALPQHWTELSRFEASIP